MKGKNAVLLVTNVNVAKDVVKEFGGKLYSLIEKYGDPNDFIHRSKRTEPTENEDIFKIEFCSIFTIIEDEKVKDLKNDFFDLISDSEVADQIMSRFKIYKEIDE